MKERECVCLCPSMYLCVRRYFAIIHGVFGFENKLKTSKW